MRKFGADIPVDMATTRSSALSEQEVVDAGAFGGCIVLFRAIVDTSHAG